MESALARIADEGDAAKGATVRTGPTEAGRIDDASSADAAEPRSPYLADLYGVIDEIETLFPEVVRTLHERIADLERFLAQAENPFIQHGAIAATHEVVRAVHRVITRIAGTHQPEAPES